MRIPRKARGSGQMKLEKDYDEQYICDLFAENGPDVKKVATMLGCTRQTLYRYFEFHPAAKEALEEARAIEKEIRLDDHEKTVEAIAANRCDDPSNALKAALAYLKNHGARRGWKTEHDDTTSDEDRAIRAALLQSFGQPPKPRE